MGFEGKRGDFHSIAAASDETGKALYKPAGLKRPERLSVARFYVYPLAILLASSRFISYAREF